MFYIGSGFLLWKQKNYFVRAKVFEMIYHLKIQKSYALSSVQCSLVFVFICLELHVDEDKLETSKQRSI
jgi:hypothetical protein